MRKITFLLTSLTFYSFFVCNAQKTLSETDGIKIGVLGGLNLARVNSKSEQAQKNRTAPALGFNMILPVLNRFSIILEPMYIGKGAKFNEGENVMVEPKSTMKSSFIELPVLFSYSFLKDYSPYIVAGPTIGYNLNTMIEMMPPGFETTVNMKDLTEAFEFGMSFGGGISLPINKICLFLECRYALGFTNLQKGGEVLVDLDAVEIPVTFDKDDNQYENRGLQILIGITTPL
jgi:hypothetical protein